VDELVAAREQLEDLIDRCMTTVRAGRIAFGSDSAQVGDGSVSLKELGESLQTLSGEELASALSEEAWADVEAAQQDLSECQQLCQWAKKSTQKMVTLYQTKQPQDLELAISHARNMKEEISGSVQCQGMLQAGEEAILNASQACDLVIAKGVKYKEKSEVSAAVSKEPLHAAQSTEPAKDTKKGVASRAPSYSSAEPSGPLPPHAREAADQVEWLRGLVEARDAARVDGKGRQIDSLLAVCVEQIRSMGKLSPDARSTDVLLSTISDVEETMSTCVTTASFDASLQYILLEIFTALLQSVIEADSEEMVMMLGHVCGAVCRMAGKAAGKVLRAMLSSSCYLTVPHSSEMSSAVPSIPQATSNEQHRRVVIFMACQVSSTETPPLVDLAAGWSWLVRVGALLHQRSLDPTSSCSLTNLMCQCVKSFLRIVGRPLRQAYVKEFLFLLEKVEDVLPRGSAEVAVTELRELLTAVTRDGRVPTVLFKNQDSFGIYASAVVRFVCSSLEY
jgi:hypothetical protein